MSISYKITSLSVPLSGSSSLPDNKLKSSTNADINFPSEGGTLATQADISDLANTYLTQTDAASTYLSKTDASDTYLTQTNASNTYLTQTNASNTYTTQTDHNALETRFGRLLDYLEAWINVGNLSMSDIKSSVNGSS